MAENIILARLSKPEMPIIWHYEASIKKTKSHIYKWKTLTEELADELWIAREKLSMPHRPKLSGTNVPLKTWDKCPTIYLGHLLRRNRQLSASRWRGKQIGLMVWLVPTSLIVVDSGAFCFREIGRISSFRQMAA